MQTYTAIFDDYELPQDGTAALGVLTDILSAAKTSLLTEMYGFANATLATALAAAQARGVDVWLIADHSEATTPTEVQILHSLLQSGFPADHVCIMTSPRHAIMHRKQIIVDAETVISGSTNWSQQAFLKQNNDFLVIHSPEMAAALTADFHALFAWGRTNEPGYQLAASLAPAA